MMRQSRFARYYWSRYRMPSQMPKFDGPAPVAAPQNMNSTKTNEFIDPIDDKFPISIRGNMVRPDVPEDQYVDSWYVCTSMTHHLGDYRPWSASAPPNAFRFRPFNEFDSKGREYIQQIREATRYDPKATRGSGQKGFPFRESYLTKMWSSTAKEAVAAAAVPSRETVLDRAVEEKARKGTILSPMQVQRDVGRLEAPLPCAGTIQPDAAAFPFRWNTDDWYEYEVSKVRNRRFVFDNRDESGVNGSEVTYRIILEGFWDHHVMKLAEDVCLFLKDVGRQVVEEKLVSVRKMLASLDSGMVDPDVVEVFNSSRKGVFGSADHYDVEEVANFMRSDLVRLEEQCLSIISRCNTPVPGAANIYDAHVSWPHVEKLEPWVRMAEFWTSSSDTSFTELEMSTAHYEFRKYFRQIVVKMPFQSTEFEQRMYSIRHWLHRQTSCEFHTVHRRNIIHDSSVFPTEHDVATPTSHEHHRLFSFALDWQSSPVNYLCTELIKKDDTWETVATRLGCTVQALRAANPSVKSEALEIGDTLVVPPEATRRLTSFGAAPRVLLLNQKDGTSIKTWQQAATVLDCGVEELQAANGEAALRYKGDAAGEGTFDPSTTELLVPHSAWVATSEEAFATTEIVYEGDTWESVAQRLGTSEQALRQANESVTNITDVGAIHVPSTATTPRRLVHPQLRTQAATDALIARTIGERKVTGLEAIPGLPENASQFPHEYHTATSRFPPTPSEVNGTDNWLAYTAAYLDKELTSKDEPTAYYNVNKLWPMQQVPGKVDQTPFEEDQTWLLNPIPVHQLEQHDPEKDIQDLPFVNHEQFPRSLDWTAP